MTIIEFIKNCENLNEIESLFEKSVFSKPHAEQLINILSPYKIPRCEGIYTQFYQQEEVSVRNKFFLDIYRGKIHWKKTMGSLVNFLHVIFRNKWVNEIRANTQRKQSINDKILEISSYQQKTEMIEEQHNKIYDETYRLPIEKRVVIKIWAPHFFEYSLSKIECEWLKNKTQENVQSLLNELEEIILNKSNKENIAFVSAEFIATKLNLTRNNVDQIISRFRARLRETKNGGCAK